MRQQLFVLGLTGLLGLSTVVQAHEESTTPPAPEGASAPAPAVGASRSVKPSPTVATKPARSANQGTPGATRPPARPLRLTLDADQRLAATQKAPTKGGDAEPAPVAAVPATAGAGNAAAPSEAPVKRGPLLKLAPSAREIEGERQTVLKPAVEPRPDQYENQRPDVPAPTQVRRVPGPGSGVGSTAAERKATMLENSGPQQNSTYRRW